MAPAVASPHELTMTVLMTPDMASFSGNVHGGTLLKLPDRAAYACASRYAASCVVTVSVDQVVFRQPIHVGELVTFLASVNRVGSSSREIGIKVVAEDIRTQQMRHVDSCGVRYRRASSLTGRPGDRLGSVWAGAGESSDRRSLSASAWMSGRLGFDGPLCGDRISDACVADAVGLSRSRFAGTAARGGSLGGLASSDRWRG